VIKSFGDRESQDIYDGRRSKRAIKRLSPVLWRIAHRKFEMLNAAVTLEDLKIPPSNHLELLRGKFKGYYSIRINDQWRIIPIMFQKFVLGDAKAVKICRS
jgi:toxin HigB-1